MCRWVHVILEISVNALVGVLQRELWMPAAMAGWSNIMLPKLHAVLLRKGVKCVAATVHLFIRVLGNMKRS